MQPRLREELALYPGPRTMEGAPTWSLHDPVRNAFFSIDWLTFEVLCRWDLEDPLAIVRSIDEETTIRAEIDDVKAVLRFLGENELVQNPTPQGTAWYREQVAKRKAKPGAWLLHHYLFFRLPLWRPDRWLARTLPLVEPLFSPAFLWLTVVALLVGLIETSRQWETFVTTLMDTFSLQGLAGFMAALVFAKFMHELGHAYTAKRFGCRVPSMGVAFLVMFPVAYTDVNEVWKLEEPAKRFAVGFAGIRTEIIIAAWATLLWAVSPDGWLRGVMFVLATTTWITTIVVNASPFMRFDGYFMLMDWLGISNLHQRAFAMGRWKLREVLFGLGDHAPEAASPLRRRGLILFAYATWLYRLVVFSGIAVLVYSMAPKPVGPFLGAVELCWFIILPMWKEVAVWGKNAGRIWTSGRFVAVLAGVALLIVAASVPWDPRIHAQGVLRPVGYFTVFVPEAARIVSIPVATGGTISKDDVIFELESPDLDFRRRLKEVQAATATWQSSAAGVNADLRGQIPMIQATRARLDAELVGVSAEKSRFQIKAPADGMLFLSDLDIQPGNWVRKNENVATVMDPSRWHVVTYLPEADLGRIKVGDAAVFYPEHSGLDRVPLTVEFIDRDTTRLLPDGILASSLGGKILVRETSSGLVPEFAVYRVVLSLATPYSQKVPTLHRGDVVVFGETKPLVEDFLRTVAALFIREAGF